MDKFRFLALLLAGSLAYLPALASSQAGLIFSAEPQLMLGNVAEEKITIQNSGSDPLTVGMLQVDLPAALSLLSATPAQTSYENNQAQWDIPNLPAGDSYEVRFVVKAGAVGSGFITSANYSAGGVSLVSTSVQTTVGPLVLGEQTSGNAAGSATSLPRTGQSPWNALAILSVMFAVFFPWRRGLSRKSSV